MDQIEMPDTGAVYTFGKTRFANDKPSHFFIKNDPIIGIACGDEFTIVLCESGRLFSFGNNEYGQLGLGHLNEVDRPSCIKGLKPFRIKLIVCGRSHSIAVSENNHIYTFGNNSEGQLGQGNTIDQNIPKKIEDSPLRSCDKIVQLSAGHSHSALLSGSGCLFVWGSNTKGQLGLNLEENIEKRTSLTLLRMSEKIVFMSCGYFHTGFITESRKIYMFGANENGQLGINTVGNYISTPSLIDIEIKFLKIFCGGHHSFFISEDTELFTCGLNIKGQLGIGDENVVFASEPININKSTFDDSNVEFISCGESHTVFVTENGKLYTCGESKHSRLCYNVDENIGDSQSYPKLVKRFDNLIVRSAVCGRFHTIVSTRKFPENINYKSIPSKSTVLAPISKNNEVPHKGNCNALGNKDEEPENITERFDVNMSKAENVNSNGASENNLNMQNKFEFLEAKNIESRNATEVNLNNGVKSEIIQISANYESPDQSNLTTINNQEAPSDILSTDTESTSTCGDTDSDISNANVNVPDISVAGNDANPTTNKSENKVIKILYSFKRKQKTGNKIENINDLIHGDEDKKQVVEKETLYQKSKTCTLL